MDNAFPTTPTTQMTPDASDHSSLSVLATVTSAAQMLVTSTVNTLEWRIKTQFTGPEKHSQLVIRLTPRGVKGNKLSFIIPSKGTPNNKRTEVIFREGGNEGIDTRFGEFLVKQMQATSRKWKKVADMRNWVTTKAAWRTRVRKLWNAKVVRRTRMSQLRGGVTYASPPTGLLFQAKDGKTTDVMVPIMQVNGKVPAIRVYARPANKQGGRTRKAQVLVWIPARLLRNKTKGLEFSMGVDFGADLIWQKFVVEYLQYAVSKWKTAADIRTWVTKDRFNFKEFLNALFRSQREGVTPTSPMPWRLAPSTIEPDDQYMRNGWFTRGECGYGVYCTVAGEHTFRWHYDDERISYVADKRKNVLTQLQKNYQATANGDSKSEVVWVPTTDSLRCGAVQPCYLVQHRKTNPTHILDFDAEGRTILQPLRPSVVGEEFCFDYRLGTSVDDSPQKAEEEVPQKAEEEVQQVDEEEVPQKAEEEVPQKAQDDSVPPALDSDSGWSSEDSAMEKVD